MSNWDESERSYQEEDANRRRPLVAYQDSWNERPATQLQRDPATNLWGKHSKRATTATWNPYQLQPNPGTRFLPRGLSSLGILQGQDTSFMNLLVPPTSTAALSSRSAISFFSTSTTTTTSPTNPPPPPPPPKHNNTTKNNNSNTKTHLKVKVPSRSLARSKIPTPNSAPPVEDNPLANLPEPKSLLRKGTELLWWAGSSLVRFVLLLPANLYWYAVHPAERRAAWSKVHDVIQHEVHHYWMGTKLLWADVRTARDLLFKMLRGHALTRRERKQLLRTTSDLFRLVPFSMFVIIPFMEFALPFALRIFPNLLPSTFQDSLKAEENMKREVKSRIAMAQFFQETLEELAKEQKRKARRRKEELMEAGVSSEDDDTIDEQEDSAASMLEFLQKAQSGEMIPPNVIIRYAKYFQDDLTLDNMPRMQLINMCKYMAIPPYGTDAFLRFQLRHRIRVLKEDDQRILWEGIDSLTKMELREACQERGMRSTGLSKDAYKNALQQWLDLSVNKNVPIALLVMSRTFFLREDMFQPNRAAPTTLAGGTADSQAADSGITGLADTISGLDKEVLNEVILQVATSEEKKSDPTIQKLKLEVLDQQNELIREEQEAREAAAALKKLQHQPTDDVEPVVSDASLVGATTTATHTAKATTTTGVSADGRATTEARALDETMESLEPPLSSSADGSVPSASATMETEKFVVEEEERDLSAEEMDALRHLLSDDPVSKEREDLAKLKADLEGGGDTAKESSKAEDEAMGAATMTDATLGGVSDALGTMDTLVEGSSMRTTAAAASPLTSTDLYKVQTKVESPTASMPPITEVSQEQDEEFSEDPIVQRLKKRIESMVDKIEVQLSDVQVKIGDKLHFLDKDRDGILSREEVASVLQQVFKRKITFEEAMEITCDMVSSENISITKLSMFEICKSEQCFVMLFRMGIRTDSFLLKNSCGGSTKRDS